MKKHNFIFIVLCCIFVLVLVGCAPKAQTHNTENTESGDSQVEVDYSGYPFAGKQWIRDTECDETLCFLPSGEFRYSCACGSSVNDADVVESYSYDDTTKIFTLNCYEEIEDMITEIKLISCDGEVLELDFDGEIRVFYLDESKVGAVEDTETEDADMDDTDVDDTEDVGDVYEVDLTKISPMIQELASKDVIVAAKTVIEAFLRYEDSATIKISGNSQRFMNDMTYVIHCTCPMFGAFTDFSEMTSYDEASGTVSWSYFVDESEFDAKLQLFYDTIGSYLSNVSTTDSEAMRAMLLYYAIIDDLNYDYGLIGDSFESLGKEEANLKSSPYYVLVEKSGICTNIAQAYMFLCTQADIACGTVLHMGGSGMHMWNTVQVDGKYYYCDPTWDANTSMKYFGITAADRASWAGEYSDSEGTMLSVTIPEKYQVSDSRFEALRGRLPVEISELKVDKTLQTITFVGYEYEYVFECKNLKD